MIRERLSPFRCIWQTFDWQFKAGKLRKLIQVFYKNNGEIVIINRLPPVIFYEISRAGQMRRQQRKISMGEIQRVRVKRFAVV